MIQVQNYDSMKLSTNELLYLINIESNGWFPKGSLPILENIRLDWIWELTKKLDYWKQLAEDGGMNDGERILAYANLGSITEVWLKIYLICFIRDYQKTH